MKQIDFEGTTHQFPEDFSDADIAKALGGGQPQPQPAAPKSSLTQGYEKYVRDPAMKALRGAVGSILDTHVPAEMTGGRPDERTSSRLAPFTEQVAGAVVPQTPIQAGALAGTLGAGAVARGASPLASALFRVLGGGVGGEAGNALMGGQPGRGALEGGGGAALGEGIGAVGGKVARSLPGAKGRIAADDAAAYAGEMGRQSPPLAGAQTVQDLQGLAQGRGREALGGAKEQIVQQIERLTGNPQLSVPSLDVNRNFTLREANDLLSEIGARMKNPLERTFQGRDQTKLYGQVANELDAALGAAHPDAPALFQQAQGDYKKGLALLRPLQQQNAYRLSPGDTQFNTPAIQRSLQNPKNAAGLRNKLGDADYDTLLNVMTRGAGQGQDVLASGRGGMLDALQQTIGRGTNSGAMGYLGVPLRTALPNVGSQYTGRQPMSLPPVLQQALDAVLQRQAGQGSQP